MMGGTYQLRGARSRTSQVSSSGTEVPMWSGWKIRMNDAGAELRRDHDPGRDEHAHDALAALGPAPAEQAAGQHHQRVGDRGRGVQHVGVQPADRFHDHVLGQLGGVERHVGDRPAAQQRVAVQHVPGLHRDGRAVGGDGLGPGHGQIAQVQANARGGQADRPGHQDQTANPGRARPQPLSRGARRRGPRRVRRARSAPGVPVTVADGAAVPSALLGGSMASEVRAGAPSGEGGCAARRRWPDRRRGGVGRRAGSRRR